MTRFQINSRNVNPRTEPNLQRALERVYREPPFRSLHNHDTNFTTTELTAIDTYLVSHPSSLSRSQSIALRTALSIQVRSLFQAFVPFRDVSNSNASEFETRTPSCNFNFNRQNIPTNERKRSPNPSLIFKIIC